MTSPWLFISSFKQTARIILPGILFWLLLGACKNDPKEIDALTGKASVQEDRAEDVTFIYSEAGKVKAKIFAHTFIRNEAASHPYTDMKDGLKVEFYNDSLMVTTTLTARYARYYEKDNNILVRDSVVVINKKGERLNTEELVWNQNIRRIYTQKAVKITTPTQVSYGDGLDANEDFSDYKITNFKGAVLVNKSDLPQ